MCLKTVFMRKTHDYPHFLSSDPGVAATVQLALPGLPLLSVAVAYVTERMIAA